MLKNLQTNFIFLFLATLLNLCITYESFDRAVSSIRNDLTSSIPMYVAFSSLLDHRIRLDYIKFQNTIKLILKISHHYRLK